MFCRTDRQRECRECEGQSGPNAEVQLADALHCRGIAKDRAHGFTCVSHCIPFHPVLITSDPSLIFTLTLAGSTPSSSSTKISLRLTPPRTRPTSLAQASKSLAHQAPLERMMVSASSFLPTRTRTQLGKNEMQKRRRSAIRTQCRAGICRVRSQVI